MSQTNTDSTQRFSDRVENYVKYRPGYPPAVVKILEQEAGLASASTLADIGSGTGISTKLFLDAGHVVYGVEPNAEMRAAAEKMLQSYSSFHSVAETAEATTLPDNSVDCAIAAQSFHWFDPQPAGQEAARILKPSGIAVLMWNSRRTGSTPFLKAYESLLQEYGTDYLSVGHRNVPHEALKAFLGNSFELRKLDNEQVFDFQSLSGRLLSLSYAPAKGHPNFQPMMRSLFQIFEQHNHNGLVRVKYDTELYWSRGYPQR